MSPIEKFSIILGFVSGFILLILLAYNAIDELIDETITHEPPEIKPPTPLKRKTRPLSARKPPVKLLNTSKDIFHE